MRRLKGTKYNRKYLLSLCLYSIPAGEIIRQSEWSPLALQSPSSKVFQNESSVYYNRTGRARHVFSKIDLRILPREVDLLHTAYGKNVQCRALIIRNIVPFGQSMLLIQSASC
ncbi:hypothetical protein V2G26_017898 [Clonostachys chloroleuca]